MPDSNNTHDEMPLSWVHAGRLRAAERELLALVAELQGIAQEGQPRAVSANAHRYTPLAEAVRDPFTQSLTRLSEAAHRVGELAGPDPQAQAAHGPGATRMALSSRLARLEDTFKDLDPDRLQARYGDLPPAVAGELQQLCIHMREIAREARGIIEAGPLPENPAP